MRIYVKQENKSSFLSGKLSKRGSQVVFDKRCQYLTDIPPSGRVWCKA